VTSGAERVLREQLDTRLDTVAQAEISVLVLIDHLALGGAELLLGQFARAAPSAGIRVSVASLRERDGNPAAAQLRAAGVDPVNLEIRPRLGPRSLLQVRRHIGRVRPDLVHTHLGTADTLGSIAGRSLGVPVVSSIHAAAREAGVGTRARLTVHALARRHGAARIVAVSEGARRAYVERGWAGPERVVTIHNGVDVSPEPGAGALVRAELGLAPDDLVVGMVSALRPEKGHDIGIAAVRSLIPRFPNLRLLIAGSGGARPEIARLAAEAGDVVLMSGPRRDVMRVFDAVDVCLHPSRADAFPTSLLEAMAASVPVVTTAVGGIPEIVVDGRTALVVPPPPSPAAVADALARLLADPARRRRLGAAGRERYEEQFTARPWIRRIRALYEEVLGS
jgi:glycosyltransferase involved in cell wall biosynthesis